MSSIVRKVDDDVRGGIREILTGSPEDHGFTRPTWMLEILRLVVETVLGVVLSLGSLCCSSVDAESMKVI